MSLTADEKKTLMHLLGYCIGFLMWMAALILTVGSFGLAIRLFAWITGGPVCD